MIAVGLVACLVAALASTGKGEGEAANLEWVEASKPVESQPAPVPGGQGEMQLTEARIRATGTNVSGYALYVASANLTIPAGSPIDGGHITCTVKAPRRDRNHPAAAAACAPLTRAPPKRGSTTRKCRKRC